MNQVAENVHTEQAASIQIGSLIEIGPNRFSEVYANERLRDESGGQEMTRIETMGRCVLTVPARMPLRVSGPSAAELADAGDMSTSDGLGA